VVDEDRGEGEVTAASPAPGRRLGRDRGRFALALVGLAGLGVALVRALPTRSDLLDAVGDPAPDLSAVAGALSAAATEAGVDRALLFALAAVESAGDPGARSRAGAVGLLQLEQATAGEVGRQLGLAPGVLALEDPCSRISPATRRSRWPATTRDLRTCVAGSPARPMPTRAR
jgi:soluble lytic murein transglycosylase-like protein